MLHVPTSEALLLLQELEERVGVVVARFEPTEKMENIAAKIEELLK